MNRSVAFITDAPRIAGSEIWLREILPQLARLGVQVMLALPDVPDLEPIAQAVAEQVTVIRYRNAGEISETLTSADIRVLQAWFPKTYRLLDELPRPRWVFVHDQIVYHYPLGLKGLYSLIFHHTKARAMQSADGVLTCSRWAARHLETVHGLKAVGIPNGVDPEKFRPPKPGEKAELRLRFGFRRFTWVMPARFSLEKNHITALLTARLTPEADFVFVGGGPMRGNFAKLAQLLRLRNVRFLPFVSDMPKLYRAADGFFFPTLAENQSLTTLEAMATGLPVITSNLPAQTELITHWEDGLTLLPRPSVLSKGLKWVMTHPKEAQAFGRSARAKVERDHTLEKAAKQLYRTLESLTSI